MNFITRSESYTAKSNLPEVNVIMSIKDSFHIQMYISGSGPMNILNLNSLNYNDNK